MVVIYGDQRLPDRFWEKVRVSESGCWEWTAGKCGNGYGQFTIGNRRSTRAHRIAFVSLVSDVPLGLVLDHLCRNRACVFPGHLEPVTNRENILRGVSRSAEQARKTHCHRGHAFTPENTVSPIKHPARRICKACIDDPVTGRRAYRASRKGKDTATIREYEASHKAARDASRRAYRLSHRDECAVKSRAYHESHREELNAKKRAKRALAKEQAAGPGRGMK